MQHPRTIGYLYMWRQASRASPFPVWEHCATAEWGASWKREAAYACVVQTLIPLWVSMIVGLCLGSAAQAKVTLLGVRGLTGVPVTASRLRVQPWIKRGCLTVLRRYGAIGEDELVQHHLVSDSGRCGDRVSPLVCVKTCKAWLVSYGTHSSRSSVVQHVVTSG